MAFEKIMETENIPVKLPKGVMVVKGQHLEKKIT